MESTPSTEQFEPERRRLFGLAYRMLGSVADADDIVQEAWLRFQPADGVVNPAAFLTTVTTRLCIDRLRSARSRREVYVGPWLPEPLLTDRDPAHIVELDESVRLGFLHVLDELSPVERAVFLLHDVFDVAYAEVAAAVGKTESNCRQIARRARDRVRRGEGRRQTVPAAEASALLDAFLAALLSGDPAALRDMLADDVVVSADGGPTQRAARFPVVGADRVTRFMANLAKRSPPGAELAVVEVNGHPGVAVVLDGVPVMIVEAEFADGCVERAHLVTSPDKLRAARRAWIEAAGGDADDDPRVADPPRLVPARSRIIG